MPKKKVQKIYAVFNHAERKRMLFLTWDVARRHIEGKHVSHKSFLRQSKTEALQWLDKTSGFREDTPIDDEDGSDVIIPETKPGEYPVGPVPAKSYPFEADSYYLNIYTDGSHKKATGQIGAGAVVIYEGKEYHWAASHKTFREAFPKGGSNPTAEMFAAASVLKAISQSKHLFERSRIVRLYADYNGVLKYANGEWKHKNKPEDPFQRSVGMFMDALRHLNKWRTVWTYHVKGHSGNYGNDAADMLAECNRDLNELVTVNLH